MQQELPETTSQLRNKLPGLWTEIQAFRKYHGFTKAQYSKGQRKSPAYTPTPARSRSQNIIVQDKQNVHCTDTQINLIW